MIAWTSGWSYKDLLPYFKRADNNSRLAGPFHGTDGPVRVFDGLHRHQPSDAFIVAAQQASGAPGLGVYEENHSNTESRNGFKLSGSGTKGAMLPVEIERQPRLGGLPGEYRAGYNYSSTDSKDEGSTELTARTPSR